ncbi:MAG: family 16 glycosylhydrolase, partial [Candidatus Neomarinimicrobiota bacterium]|nr:family 16 glycosylhydrolase [Candidatus Neomarinimicrobiota bacterium]
AWTIWIVDGEVEVDLDYTENGPSGGSGEALRILASNWGNGGVYQALNLEENNVYELSGLFKGVGCDQNWVEISILDYEPQQGVDVGVSDIIIEQHFWHCGASASWNWDTDFAGSCGSNAYMPGSPPGVFTVPGTGVYYLLIKAGGVVSDVTFDNLNLEVIDDNPPDTAWVLVWSDEFDSSDIDMSKWSYDIGTGDWGWGNNEQQYYTSNSNNSFIEDGKLIIQALLQNYGGANYTSARMVTRDQGDWTYGRIEVRAKLPGGVGTWPAIWMLPTDWVYGGWPYSGEIDIMEHVGFEPNVIHGTAHSEVYNWWNGIPPPGGSIYVNGAISSFHDYTLEWDEDYLKWYVDDVHYFTYVNDQDGNYATWPFDQRFHLLLNIAIGGTWGGQQGIDDSIFPVRMEVDYVRVYEASSELSSQLETIPNTYNLHYNYPNPFNPATTLCYFLPEQTQVTLTVYDLMGKEIIQLVDAIQNVGNKTVQWDGTDSFGRPVSAGLYLYQIRMRNHTSMGKMALLK